MGRLRRLLVVVWGYTFICWVYVTAMQLTYPGSLYSPLAVWVPIRLDYFGETMFILSFLLAIMICLVDDGRKKLESKEEQGQPKPGGPGATGSAPLACPKCGVLTPAGNFCDKCGTSLR